MKVVGKKAKELYSGSRGAAHAANNHYDGVLTNYPNYLIKTLKISAYIFLTFKSALIIIIYFPQIINAKFLRLGYHQVRKKLVSDGQLQKRNKIIETKKT